jgi:hypothetical protein
VGPRAFLDAVVKRKIPSPSRESNPRTTIVHRSVKYRTNCELGRVTLQNCVEWFGSFTRTCLIFVCDIQFSHTKFHVSSLAQ